MPEISIHTPDCPAGLSSSGACACGAQPKPVHFGPDGWPTKRATYKRPPITEVPLHAHHFAWREPVDGGWREHMSRVFLGACDKCALYWRMWDDEPRPCPSCTERNARQAEKEDAARFFEGGKLREAALLAELAAARKVIEVVADRQATPGSNIPSGAEYVHQLVSALAEYHAVRAKAGGS